MTDFKELGIPGCYEITNFCSADGRGSFVKTFRKSLLAELRVDSDFKESFYSFSAKNVIRGLHFQLPEMDHAKLVYCAGGKVLDVIVDLRRSLPSFAKVISVELHALGSSVYIPKGCAHGFLALNDQSLMVYHVTSEYSKEHDTGILWNSINFDWPVKSPIISDRDLTFPKLEEFKTPFS